MRVPDPVEQMSSSKQPNSHHCFVCGLNNPYGLRLTFFDNGDDQVWCEYTIPDHYQGFPGLAHGGVVAAIMDEVCGRTALIADPSNLMMTAKMEVKYRIPVPTGQQLQITGRMTRSRGRLAWARGQLRLLDGRMAAEAILLLSALPKQFNMEDVLDDLGWTVYD